MMSPKSNSHHLKATHMRGVMGMRMLTVASTCRPSHDSNKRRDANKKRDAYTHQQSKSRGRHRVREKKTYHDEYNSMTALLEYKSSIAMRDCNPKQNKEFISPECYAIWTDIEEILLVMETIKKLDELQDLDFDI